MADESYLCLVRLRNLPFNGAAIGTRAASNYRETVQ